MRNKIIYKTMILNVNKIKHVGYFSQILNQRKKYYKEIFDKEFSNCSHIIPYFWMPKYTNASDPSARTLDIYILQNK